MRRVLSLLFLMAIFAASAALAGGGQTKVDVCHIPPGNPANWHTITVGQPAVNAHVTNHGDMIGTCDAICESLCEDGNMCTQDVDPAGDDCECLDAPGPPVDCIDDDPCTVDDCDPDTGCDNSPVVCEDDGNLCTVEMCDPLTGDCVGTPVVCPTGETCDPTTGECGGSSATCPCLDDARWGGWQSVAIVTDLPPLTITSTCIAIGEDDPEPGTISVTGSGPAPAWGVDGAFCSGFDLGTGPYLIPVSPEEAGVCAGLIREYFDTSPTAGCVMGTEAECFAGPPNMVLTDDLCSPGA